MKNANVLFRLNERAVRLFHTAMDTFPHAAEVGADFVELTGFLIFFFLLMTLSANH